MRCTRHRGVSVACVLVLALDDTIVCHPLTVNARSGPVCGTQRTLMTIQDLCTAAQGAGTQRCNVQMMTAMM
eukprot:17283-Eustigmatos_ZCMA.PRE.1